MNILRILPIILLGQVFAAEPQYPLWDGHESVANYAQKVNLPPMKTLDLGSGIKIELVLIPAGKFIMGTPEPTPVDEDGFHRKIVTGQSLFAASAGILLIMFGDDANGWQLCSQRYALSTVGTSAGGSKVRVSGSNKAVRRRETNREACASSYANETILYGNICGNPRAVSAGHR